jgi:hypothetical protein
MATAELGSNRFDAGAYVHGYFTAAQKLAELLSENEVPPDTVVYPALFLLRHGLELGFKALLEGYVEELHPVAPEMAQLAFHGHYLLVLWKKLRPFLEDLPWDAFAPGSSAKNVELDDIEALVKLIDEVDHDGDAARYGRDKKGSPTLEGISFVNLEALREICDAAGQWIQEVIWHRDEVVSFVQGSRLERQRRLGAVQEPFFVDGNGWVLTAYPEPNHPIELRGQTRIYECETRDGLIVDGRPQKAVVDLANDLIRRIRAERAWDETKNR